MLIETIAATFNPSVYVLGKGEEAASPQNKAIFSENKH